MTFPFKKAILKNIDNHYMNNTIIQVPISKSFRNEMVEKANNLIVPKMVSIPTIQLSPKAATRYDKMAEELKTGKVKGKSFDNVADIMKYLNS